MNTIRLTGGLGNQMFQYAFGRALSLRNDTSLLLDLEEFSIKSKKFTSRNYELHNFNIVNECIVDSNSKRPPFTKRKFIYKILRKILRHYQINLFNIVVEKSSFFNKELLFSNESKYYDGYWQSYKYFEDYRDVICNEFRPKVIYEEDNIFTKMMDNSNSVAVHIRRGDYVTNQYAKRHHYLLSLDYYYEAINFISSLCPNVHLFLFSDDPGWVSENISLKCPFTMVEYNGIDRSYMDIYLMSKCSHHIIANSSFSWWGAWLSHYKGKVVIAPKRWFLFERPINDLLPDNWIKI